MGNFQTSRIFDLDGAVFANLLIGSARSAPTVKRDDLFAMSMHYSPSPD